jgi:DNA invertase Pin-like site-specific DNA recombinase
MNILVIGSGGREHAIANSVAKSSKVDKIYCAPGNAGIASLAECVDINAMDIDGMVTFAKEKEIDLAVVGMDDPLVAGMVDALETAGIRAFGPRKNAAIIEGSKAFSKDLMKKYDIPKENYYIEKVSGKDTNRPMLQKLLATVQEGDVIHVHDFSRLSRSVADLLKLVEELTEKGVHLISNKENLDTSTPTGKLMLTMIGAINEFERTNLLERQKEGIAIAVKEGKFRKKNIDFDLFKELDAQILKGELTVTAACEKLGFKSRKTWYNLREELAKKESL